MSQEDKGDFAVRRATPGDYPSFVRLFPELLVDDPVPAAEIWASTFVPSTWMAVRGLEVLGYCYCQKYAAIGYVRNVVVAPQARRAGVGRELMRTTAAELRAQGKTGWCLNVKADNRAALALYESVGMRPKYRACSFRFDWRALGALRAGSAHVRPLAAAREATVEALFDLPEGQLASARGLGRSLFEATMSDRQTPLGLAVFDQKFPGAFPFRVKSLDAVTPLLEAMRQLVPTDEFVNLVAEDDEQLVALLLQVGGSLRHDVVHLAGAL
jgi:ribosomal protein S18 acetylase RimI-like enzyme